MGGERHEKARQGEKAEGDPWKGGSVSMLRVKKIKDSFQVKIKTFEILNEKRAVYEIWKITEEFTPIRKKKSFLFYQFNFVRFLFSRDRCWAFV